MNRSLEVVLGQTRHRNIYSFVVDELDELSSPPVVELLEELVVSVLDSLPSPDVDVVFVVDGSGVVVSQARSAMLSMKKLVRC